MTTTDQRLARALKQLTEDISEVADSPEARLRTVAALEAELGRRTGDSRPRRPWVAPALAAALALLLPGAGLWLRAQPNGVGRIVQGQGTKATRWLANDERVSSGGASMALELPGGVKVSVEPQSEFQVRDDGARVVLIRGGVAADITSSEATFLLESGETRFSARGAHFSARAHSGCDGRAELRVTEGTVTIGEDTRVDQGEVWPRCAPEVHQAPAELAPTEVPSRVVPKRATPPPPPEKEARLARQNELYLRALELQRAGQPGAAVQALEPVLADQTSPLAEAALAQKMRWLSELDRSRARDAARDYLRLFPMGFGRAEAEGLILEER